jgi:exopolysaccharide production protein ExoQ
MQPALAARGEGLYGLHIRLPFIGELTKNHLDFLAWMVWIYVTTNRFVPFADLLRYLLAGYFCAGLWLHGRTMLPTLARAWPLFMIPVLYIVAMQWSPVPANALRHAVFLALTALIPVFLATRLSARQIMIGLFVVELWFGIQSLGTPNIGLDGGATGVFNQKNWLAVHMFFLYLSSLILALDKRSHIALRGAACLGLAVAFTMIVLSRSGTNLIVTILSTVAIAGHSLIWAPAARIRHMRSLIALSLAVILCSTGFVLFGVMQFDPLAAVLESLGKDATLTGRTVLWDTARHLMEESPFGLGRDGFWRADRGDAVALVERFWRGDGWVRFSFHNSYYEIGVELGYLGMYVLIFCAAWASFCTLRTWLLNQTLDNAFFVVIGASVLLRAMAEPDLTMVLSPIAILFYTGALRRDPRPDPAPVADPVRDLSRLPAYGMRREPAG